MENKLIKCSRLSVDCVVNDPVDIRCGGPEYLGFDFNVKEDETEEMKKFIEMTLETFGIPLINLYHSKTNLIEEKYVWTKEKIVEEIKKDETYLKHQASRNYKRR